MKALITGINGFVGSYLAEELLARGFEVYGTYFDRNMESIADLSSRLKLFELDITNSDKVEEVISHVRPDFIFHLAAQSSVAASFKNPELTLKINVAGTRNLLEAIQRHCRSSKMLIICSADEYGKVNPKNIPIKETQPLAPTSPYAESKLKAEMLGLEYFSKHNLRVIISRSFSHFGPRQLPDFVCSDWSKQIAEIEKGLHEPVVSVGNLGVKRDFSDVRDVIKAYLVLIEKGMPGEVYNVCSGECYGLDEIMEQLREMSKAKFEVRVDPLRFRPVDNPIYCGSNAKLKSLGWAPKIPLSKTLKDTLDYWRSKTGEHPAGQPQQDLNKHQ